MKRLCLFLCLTLTATASERPNFLLIVTDDQRWDTVGVNDPKVALATPQMDRLAKEGINFENGFVTTPICCVSRASILSGRYSRNNGIHEFLIPMTDAVFASSYPEATEEGWIPHRTVGQIRRGCHSRADRQLRCLPCRLQPGHSVP